MYLKIQCKVSLFMSTVAAILFFYFLSLVFPVIDAQWDTVLRWGSVA